MGLLSPSSDTVVRAFTQAGEAWAQILLGEGLNLLSCPPRRTKGKKFAAGLCDLPVR